MNPREVTSSTGRFYDRNASEYAQSAFGRDMTSLIAPFLSRLPSSATILDLGSGPGRDSLKMESHGFRTVSLDISAGMLLEHRRRGGTMLVRADGTYLPFRERAFQGIWCCAAMLHLPKVSAPLLMAEATRVLVPGGTFFVSVKRGTGEGNGPDERFWSFYEPGEIVSLLESGGFRIDGSGTTADLAGRPIEWINVLASTPSQ